MGGCDRIISVLLQRPGLSPHFMHTSLPQILGMPPDEMIQQVKKDRQSKFFQKNEGKWTIKQSHSTGGKTNAITPSHNPKASLTEAIAKACTNVKKSHGDHDSFVDMILQMLTYQPQNRIRPEQGLQHSFIVEKLI